MITTFKLWRSNNYRYDFCPPDALRIGEKQWGVVTFFRIKDIRHLMPLSYFFNPPKNLEFRISKMKQKGFRSWILSMNDEGNFIFNVPDFFEQRKVNLGNLTKYLLADARPLIVDNKPTGGWEIYVHFRKIDK